MTAICRRLAFPGSEVRHPDLLFFLFLKNIHHRVADEGCVEILPFKILEKSRFEREETKETVEKANGAVEEAAKEVK